MSSSYAKKGVNQTFICASSATQMYSDWEAGEQAQQAYNTKALLAYREGEMEKLAIAGEKYQANVQEYQAQALKNEAAAIEAKGRMEAEAYQEQTDLKASQLYTMSAKSGVDVTSGSSVDILNAFAGKRAKGLAELKWQVGQEAYAKRVDAYVKESQAALTMYDAKIREGNLSMYTYQGSLYVQAGNAAKKAATSKIVATQIATISKSWQNWMGGSGSSMGDGGEGDEGDDMGMDSGMDAGMDAGY